MTTPIRRPRFSLRLTAALSLWVVLVLGACGGADAEDREMGEAADAAAGLPELLPPSDGPLPAATEMARGEPPALPALEEPPAEATLRDPVVGGPMPGRWSGASRGPHGVHLVRFAVSDDGRQLRDLGFTGYWMCDGEVRPVTAGPAGPVEIRAGRVAFGLPDAPDAGPRARIARFVGTFTETAASGTIRVAGEGCETGRLSWSANVAVE